MKFNTYRPVERAAITSLVHWFKELWLSRTPPVHPDEVDPDYRIIWTEILAKMKELGWTGDIVSLRLEWDETRRRHLDRWIKKHVEE